VSRIAIAAGLAIAAIGLWLVGRPSPAPSPSPAPGGLQLVWVGPTADADRATMGNLCASIADSLEHDGQAQEPRIKTGGQLEELRVAARDLRMRGVSIGERQTEARRAIGDYLDREAGKSGGPLDADGRRRWVQAYRAVAAACGVQ